MGTPERDRRRRLLMVALVVWAVALAVALLAPSSQDQSDMAGWLKYVGRAFGMSNYTATQVRAEFISNALIIAPLSLLGSLVWPRTTWKDWTAWAFALATLVELTQGLLLPHRTASTTDIVANTLGGLLGALLAAVGRRLEPRWRARRARRSRPAAPVTQSAPAAHDSPGAAAPPVPRSGGDSAQPSRR